MASRHEKKRTDKKEKNSGNIKNLHVADKKTKVGDISSSAIYEDISSSSKRKKKTKKGKKIALIVTSVILVVIICASIYAVPRIIRLKNSLNNINREQINSENVSANDVFSNKVINIALFGIDSRSNDISGRSDAIVILTIDKIHDKIKMTSIARDTYVSMDGHGKDKLTHAFAYGGAELAIKTINQNFNLDITDFVAINFFGLTDIIDYLGGIELDVDASEKSVMNSEYVPELNSIGIPCKYIRKTGLQTLSGSQAVAYARNRYSAGGDVARGNRQREVLEQVYKKAKSLGVDKMIDVIEMMTSNVSTSLNNKEIYDLGLWAVSNSPKIESIGLPDEECNPKSGNGAMINGVWYYIYDIDIATGKIHDFINETGSYIKADE